MCFRILSLEIRLKLLEKIMFGNKLPLNEASCFDPQWNQKISKFQTNYFIKIFKYFFQVRWVEKKAFLLRWSFPINPPQTLPPAVCAEILYPHHYQR